MLDIIQNQDGPYSAMHAYSFVIKYFIKCLCSVCTKDPTTSSVRQAHQTTGQSRYCHGNWFFRNTSDTEKLC